MPSYIKAISYYLPENVLTNSDLLVRFPDLNIADVERSTGIERRHISASDEFASDMAMKAAQNLFEEHSIDKSEIDFLILATESPDYVGPATSCMLQQRLGLSKNIGAFDLGIGCTGFVMALSVANGLIETGNATNVLLVTSENITKYINPLDKSTLLLFGDGAAAALISKSTDENKSAIHNFVFATDGRGAEELNLKYGAARFPLNKADMTVFTDKYGNTRNEANLFMNGTAVFAFSVKAALDLVKTLLAKHNMAIENIDQFVFHQANKIILDTIGKKLNLPEYKLYYCLHDTGNTVSSTIPIALYHALKEKRIKKGDTLLLATFGIGFSAAGVIITL
jgi:3-oxoacyl-[acyl-carrier-protein] synthase-3